MNRKNLPLILMLTAGAITCIITLINDYSIMGRLISLLIVLIVFYLLGNIMKWVLNYFDKQNEKKEEPEGDVIEKEPEAEGNQEEQQKQTEEK